MDQLSGALLFANFAGIGSIMLGLAKKARAIRHPALSSRKGLDTRDKRYYHPVRQVAEPIVAAAAGSVRHKEERNNEPHKATSIDVWRCPFSRVLAHKLPAPFGRKCSREKDRSEEKFR